MAGARPQGAPRDGGPALIVAVIGDVVRARDQPGTESSRERQRTDGRTPPLARLTEALPAGSRARIETRKAELRAETLLHELGQVRAMTRKAVGEALDLGQPAFARLERRTDMHVSGLSGLRSCIEAMGGRLDIVARFPHGSVVITSPFDAGEDRVEAGPVPDAERP